MATSRKRAGARPSGSVTEIVQGALAAQELGELHRARIEDRLPAGTFEALGEDLGAIQLVVPAALFARGDRRAATVSQTSAAERAKRLVMKMRASVSASDLPKDARAEFGMGTAVAVGVIKSVLAAGERILARAASHPAEAQAAGIVERDLTALRSALDAAAAADATQESRKLVQKNATATRDETLVRLEARVKRIAAAGALEFDEEPEVARKFEALTATKARSRSKKKAAASAPA